jgi:AbrB family looped-hinge helix DNA binding protein
MQITSKGQVTIPQEIRNRLGLLPHTKVAFESAGNHARIRKAGHEAGESAASDGAIFRKSRSSLPRNASSHINVSKYRTGARTYLRPVGSHCAFQVFRVRREGGGRRGRCTSP